MRALIADAPAENQVTDVTAAIGYLCVIAHVFGFDESEVKAGIAMANDLCGLSRSISVQNGGRIQLEEQSCFRGMDWASDHYQCTGQNSLRCFPSLKPHAHGSLATMVDLFNATATTYSGPRTTRANQVERVKVLENGGCVFYD